MAREITGSPKYEDGAWWGRVPDGHGRTTRMRLGEWPNSPQGKARAIETARHKAEQLRTLGLVVVPREERKKNGAPPPAQGETVAHWFDRWLEHREEAGKASVDTDRGRIVTHVIPLIGPMPIRAVARRDLERLVEDLDRKVRENVLAWKTAANVWTLTVKAFDDARNAKALALRVLESNPAADVRGPDRGVKKAKQYLYPNEFAAVMTSPNVTLDWKRSIAIATYLYVRAGELRALTWSDVDVERGIVHVHRSVDREGGSKPTKTGIRRRFAIEPMVLPLLRAMHKEAGGAGAIVQLPDDRHLARALRGVLKAAGVDREELHADDETRKQMTWHDLRATGITWLAVRGDDPLKIKQRAGHTDFKTTEGYIREAEAIREGFGTPFPELPATLLEGPRNGGSGEPPEGSEDEPNEAPGADSIGHAIGQGELSPRKDCGGAGNRKRRRRTAKCQRWLDLPSKREGGVLRDAAPRCRSGGRVREVPDSRGPSETYCPAG